MENLDFIILFTMGYIALIAFLYPKPKQTVDEVQVKKMKRGRKRYVDPNQLTLNFDKPQRLLELQSKSIRELKQLASQAKVKRYSYLTKAQLIQALSAVWKSLTICPMPST